MMTQPGFTLFDTPIGRCGIAWNEAGVAAVTLPEGREADTRARILKKCPDAHEAAPPPPVRRAIEDIVALLRGQATDLSAIVLDMTQVPPFHRRVYEYARTIGPGATLSYGEIATRIDSAGSARAVGQALGRNPFPIIVPCHRVLAAGGKLGGFSAKGGITTKLQLLTIEGAHAPEAPGLFDGEGRLGYDPDAAIAHLRAADPKLGRLIDTVGPFRLQLKNAPTMFAALAESIVYQQLSGKAAATIHARVCALFPRAQQGLSSEQILRTADDKLRAAGLSRSKLLSLRDLAQKTAAGEIPTLGEAHGMDDAALVERLTAVRGIGRWTVEMLLIFRLGRPDVLPVDDYGVRKGFAAAYRKRELPAPKDLARFGERWQPYRSVASWYLWRATEL